MNITLPPDLEQLVRRRIENGSFQSPEEVVGASLRLLQQQEAVDEQRRADLRREIQVGLEDVERGRVKPFDAEDILRRVHERLGEQAERAA